jgi:hypothetical protein
MSILNRCLHMRAELGELGLRQILAFASDPYVSSGPSGVIKRHDN